MSIDLVETLCELISIPSVNPMGGSADADIFFETRLTDHLEALFDRLGLKWQRQSVHPQRDNIVARLDGDSRRLLLFEVHQDTVPTNGMTIPAWTPEIRDGRVYGRGACDIKGGMAAMLAAMDRLRQEGPAAIPTVILACTVNEEYGFTGAQALAELWQSAGGSLISRRPDAVVVAEPTLLDVVVAHNGNCRWRCHTRGRAAHTSKLHQGDNAIYKMPPVIQAIERYQDEVTPTLSAHPLSGKPTVCVSTIRGGVSVNIVPDRCTIEIDRRLTPEEDPHRVYEEMVAYVSEHAGQDVEHEPPYMAIPGLSDRHNGQLAERLIATVRQTHEAGKITGVPYGTDAAVLAAAGVPAVVFGPGSIDQAHTADEWVEINQVEQASEIYYRFAKSLLD